MINELVDAVERMARNVVDNGVHTSMPAEIVKIDVEKGLVDVKPIGTMYYDGVEIEYPVIPQIPLRLAGDADGNGFFMPIKVGDEVLVTNCEQSTSQWLTGTEQENKNEKFELQNAIAITGIQKKANETQNEASEREVAIMQYGESRIEFTKEGIVIKGSLKVEGDVNIEGTFTCSDNASFGGDVEVAGSLSVGGSITAPNGEWHYDHGEGGTS